MKLEWISVPLCFVWSSETWQSASEATQLEQAGYGSHSRVWLYSVAGPLSSLLLHHLEYLLLLRYVHWAVKLFLTDGRSKRLFCPTRQVTKGCNVEVLPETALLQEGGSGHLLNDIWLHYQWSYTSSHIIYLWHHTYRCTSDLGRRFRLNTNSYHKKLPIETLLRQANFQQ